MKKLIVLLASVAIMHQAHAQQSFQKGTLVLGFNTGIDIYNIKEHYVDNYANTSKDTTGKAGSFNFNLGAEYGVLNWLGLGLQLKLDNYFHDSNLQSALGFEIGLIANAHIIRSEHFDLVTGFDLGISSLTLTSNDGYNDQIYGTGSWFDFHITPRLYFGRFGINLNLYFPAINYANLTSNNSTFNQYIVAGWKATGTGITFGVQYRIIN